MFRNLTLMTAGLTAAALTSSARARLIAYGDIIQAIVGIATDQRDAESWRRLEPQVDAAAARMDAKLDAVR